MLRQHRAGHEFDPSPPGGEPPGIPSTKPANVDPRDGTTAMHASPRPRRPIPTLKPQVETLDQRALLSSLAYGWAGAIFPRTDTSSSPNRLLVRFRNEVSSAERDSLMTSAGVRPVSQFPGGSLVVEVGLGINPDAALRILQAHPRSVVYAEANGELRASVLAEPLPVVSPIYPSEPLFAQQWGLNNGNDVDIDAPEAWARTRGNPGTIVAILDTGIDLNNADFVSRLWINAASSGPRNLVYGWNFVSGNGNVQDNNGHGTHVAGIVAATGNNGFGVAGVDWNARIMPLKILGASGSGSLDAAVSAIYFAADHGARVINASWGTRSPSQALADAIVYAGIRGAVFVNAAGNEGANNDLFPTYPAAYRTDNMLVVAAVDPGGSLASYSNYGPTTVDLAAPGTNILSSYPTSLGSRAVLSGTSMAAPYVTGVVSLIAGLHPDWSARQLVDRVVSTTKWLGSLNGKVVSSGMVDAAQAVGVAGSGLHGNRYVAPPPAPPPARRRFGIPFWRRLSRQRQAASSNPTAAPPQVQAFVFWALGPRRTLHLKLDQPPTVIKSLLA